MYEEWNEEPDNTPKFLVLCPMCDDKFPLVFDDISISSCQSGGIYDAWMVCPTCKYAKGIYEY